MIGTLDGRPPSGIGMVNVGRAMGGPGGSYSTLTSPIDFVVRFVVYFFRDGRLQWGVAPGFVGVLILLVFWNRPWCCGIVG